MLFTALCGYFVLITPRDEHDFTWQAIAPGRERQFCPAAFLSRARRPGIKHAANQAQPDYFRNCAAGRNCVGR
jgi:hypothetical protein